MSAGYVPELPKQEFHNHPQPKSAVDPFLAHLLDAGGSDLNLQLDYGPRIYVNRQWTDIEGFEYKLDKAYLKSVAMDLFEQDERRYNKFTQVGDANFHYQYDTDHRFRVNMCLQRGSIAITFRAIASKALPFASLGLPEHLTKITNMPNGLVLICGPTGSGKSTTLTSVVDYFNEHFPKKIVTLENPIEYSHKPKKATIFQREVDEEGYGDTLSFTAGIRNALRQKPDIILIGEMTGAAEVMAAVKAAETGHLVLATLHTSNVKDTVDRIISDTPGPEQNKIRGSLAESLRLIFCQTLVQKASGQGQVIAWENMYLHDNARNLIRNSQTHELNSYFNSDPDNMTLDNCLFDLVMKGQISKESAIFHASNKDALASRLHATVVERGGHGFNFD